VVDAHHGDGGAWRGLAQTSAGRSGGLGYGRGVLCARVSCRCGAARTHIAFRGRESLIAPMGTPQDLSDFPIIRDCNSLKGHFSLFQIVAS
jgi:hypothetical protein